MRIAFVVQRYGTEILGGSEYHCRLIAERLAPRHQVEVLTTCAQDYITWKNEYPEGTDRIRGVTVRRFANARTRDLEAFNRYSEWIFNNAHTRDDEMEWLRQQGPWCPALHEYLERNEKQYDVLIFFTYLYAPTVLGVRVAPHKTILVPTAHDEPAIRLEIYKEMFSAPAGIAYNTEVERRFLTTHFSMRAVEEETVGCGVDLAQAQVYQRDRPEDEGKDDPDGGDQIPDDERPPGWRPHLAGRGVLFKRRHRLHGPLALYGGRIDAGKGCEELIEYFSSYVQDGGDASLVLMGVKLMPLPEEPFLLFAGRLPVNDRLQALEAAKVVVVPSP
jgi:glycosyltransferase involved in cell wall biosynthesis